MFLASHAGDNGSGGEDILIWELILLLLILKIPVLWVCWVVWWAGKEDASSQSGDDPPGGSHWRPWRPRSPQPRRGGPQRAPERTARGRKRVPV